MQHLLSSIAQMDAQSLTFESLGKFVKSIDIQALKYRHLIPHDPPPGDYGRNILCLEPFEVVLIYWPPLAESAVHYHQGFYGYVTMLEGELDNVEYLFQESAGILREKSTTRYLAGGIMDEPDNVVHKLLNPNPNEGAVSLHFYYPALDTLEDLVLFNLKERSVGVLSDQALSASWSEVPGHFKEVKRDAFTFYKQTAQHNSSHYIHPVIPKPSCSTIGKMVSQYYCEQAKSYDQLDKSHKKRNEYTERINKLVAEVYRELPELHHELHIACGTGRRALRIQELSGRDYQITGVDISKEMCKLAENRGITTLKSSWTEAELPEDHLFDAAVWLYAFGHTSSYELRLKALRKIRKQLKPGAPFLFDVFNLYNENEWGPKAVATYERMHLQKAGYEKGDVFYRRAEGTAIAYLHYFSEQEIRELLALAGFEVRSLFTIGYAKDSGQIKANTSEGFFFLHALSA
ncbi:MAG: methyltransferase domain-containing protein [Bacteroidota bacterium]